MNKRMPVARITWNNSRWCGLFILTFWGIAAMSDQIEIYENDLLFYLNEFCEVNKIEDIKKESQSVWNSALYYIQKKEAFASFFVYLNFVLTVLCSVSMSFLNALL